MEHVDGFHLLAGTHKLDGLGDHGTYRECSTATGVAIELGKHHAVEVQSVVELLGCVHGILTGHGVYDEESLVGIDGLLQVRYLVHHLLVDGQTTGGIDDDHVIVFLLSLADGMLCYLDNVLVALLGIDIHADTLAYHLQLLDGSGTIDVACHQQWFLVLASLQHVGQLASEGRLTRTLKTGHQDDSRTALELQLYSLAAHQFRQFVVHYLHHQLTGLDGCEHIHTHCLLLHGVREVLGYLIVHVGIEQCPTHVLQSFGNIDLSDFSLTFQYLERPFKSLT